jgi:hypothetical protein
MQSSAKSSSSTSEEKIEDSWIPEGFVLLIGPDNKKYILPDFMEPALDQEYHSEQKKDNLKTWMAKGTVRPRFRHFVPAFVTPAFVPAFFTPAFVPAFVVTFSICLAGLGKFNEKFRQHRRGHYNVPINTCKCLVSNF